MTRKVTRGKNSDSFFHLLCTGKKDKTWEKGVFPHIKTFHSVCLHSRYCYGSALQGIHSTLFLSEAPLWCNCVLKEEATFVKLLFFVCCKETFQLWFANVNMLKCGHAALFMQMIKTMSWLEKLSLCMCLHSGFLVSPWETCHLEIGDIFGIRHKFAFLILSVFNSAPNCLSSHKETHTYAPTHTHRNIHMQTLRDSQKCPGFNHGQSRFIGNHGDSSLTCHNTLHLTDKTTYNSLSSVLPFLSMLTLPFSTPPSPWRAAELRARRPLIR